MKYSFRWFGPNDPTKLDDIRYTEAREIVTSLSHIKYGEKWSYEEILKRKKNIEKIKYKNQTQLKWSVVESLPVHNDIKLRSGKYKYYINQYKDSLINLSKNNIKTVCYNFMPLVDWIRTDLSFKLDNGSLALKYNHYEMCAFELFILKLKGAEKRYSNKEISKAKTIIKKMTNSQKNKLSKALLGGMAATDRQYTFNKFDYEISKYKDITHSDLRQNLKLFLLEIFPLLKENKINFCIHPDDPPYMIYGLPRIVSNENDIKYITSICKDEYNGITLCTGSLSVNKKNDINKIIKQYGKYINFIHLRNIKREKNSKNFYESSHLEGDVDMVSVIRDLLKEEKKRKKNNKIDYEISMRPDHGHMILYDKQKNIIPGYSLLGRMKGLSELRGVIKSLEN